MNKPKAGIVLSSHTREPSSFSAELLRKGIDSLRQKGIDVFFSGKISANDKEVREEIINIKKENVDAFIIVPGNWIEPPTLCHPLEEIRNENILLWGFPESLKLIREGHFLGSNSAFTVLRNAMRQMGFRFAALQEFPGEKADKFITDYLYAAASERCLLRTKLGLIGYCSMGIYTTCFDQHKIRKVFGTEIDTSADSYILAKKMEEVDTNILNKTKKVLAAKCRIDETVIQNDSLKKSLCMYLSLKKMSDVNGWEGISVKCQHEFSTYLKCTACLPLSMLTDDGIMCTDEGDVHALITMLIMYHLGEGAPLYFGDIYKLEEGGFLMDHCGLSPHSCAEEKSEINLIPQTPRISQDGKTTGGVISSYTFREGEVTIGRLENDREGSFIFHFTTGTVKPIASIGYGWSSLIFESKNDTLFQENQLANHYVFVYKDIEKRIEQFCKIKDLKIVND